MRLMRPSPLRRGMRTRASLALGLAILMLMSAQSGVFMAQDAESEELYDFRMMESSVRTTNLVDVPSWRINDIWNYDGYLDVRDFVSSSGVTTNIEFLDGTLTQRVAGIYKMDVAGEDTLVYRVESNGYYEAENVNLDGNNGDLVVGMDTEEIFRVSDLASIQYTATFDIDFIVQILWWTQTVHVADMVVDTSYSPPLEGYDFPLSVGEEWETDYTQVNDFSGSSDYVTIPSDSTSSNTTSWEVVSQGYPGTFYNGCAQSYNITNYDHVNTIKQQTGYKWFCPAIRGDIRSSTAIAGVGIYADHELTSYQPAGRYKQISVEVAHPLSPVDFEMSAWVNATSFSGTGGANMPLAGQSLEFRYEIGGDVQNVTTASNGSAFVTFDTGHLADDTESETDLGSHGVVAWITGEKVVGAATITIDPDVHQVDLVARSEGVTVERTRGNRTVTLDSNIGFNAISGDQLIFSVPVLNRGIIDSPGTTLMVEAPDGSTSSTSVPSLSSLEESRVNVSWTVPGNHPYGDISLSFVVDPDEQITADGNRSNNEGSFSLFVGSMPTAVLSIVSEELTLAEVVFNGLSSYDPDGGVVTCEFSVEELNGGISTSSEEDCIHEYTWDDDGTFLVTVTITDDESDQAYAEATITILNRPPDVAIGSNLDSVPVLSPVTFDIIESGDLDTQNPDAPVDIQWHSPCEEGQVGVRCTITPDAEGTYTIAVTAMDDDGATTEASLTLDVTNIAPTNPQNEVWIGPNRLVPDSVGRYFVNEGDVLILRGWADDSENDLAGHQHHWSPDAELDPDLVISSVGHYSTIEHTYQTSGQHLATLQIVDDDGASTETLIVPITVNNVVPSIAPIATLLPVAEDQLVQLSVEVTDTTGDLPNLIHCFDLDPYTDSDSEGNESDDCDVESRHLAHAWADATTAPDYIVFHVTDDDGGRDYIAISLDVNNLNPVARATTSDDNPTEGDVIFLSANGTTDSEYDMENMIYIWDLDIHEDSDGDGDAANDHDRAGMWIEVSFDGEGTRTVQMTAFDEGEGSSVTLVIQVQKAPFSLGGLVSAYGIYIGLLGMIVILGALLMQRLRPPEIDIEAPVFKDAPRRRGKRISMDDAFDDPEYDPFDAEKGKSGPKKSEGEVGPIIPEPMEPKDPQKMEGNLAHAFEELTGEAPHQDEPEEEESESAPVSVDEALDDEDIEALFDD